MRTLTDGFASRFDGATTLCLCWQLTLADGRRFGFTDHDDDVVIDGLVHAAASGFRPGPVEQRLGLDTATTCVTASLALLGEAGVTPRDLDGASVATLVVDWTRPDAHLPLDRSEIGAVTRQDGVLVADLRSPAHRLAAPTGRLFQSGCDAELGDARCKCALAPFTRTTDVVASDGDLLVTLAATGCADGWFTHGLLIASGETLRIRDHRTTPGGDMVVVWARPAAALAIGQPVTLVAGCDKSFATCRDRFANSVNFRGFPHLPGNDLVFAYARADDVAMDGGSLFR